MLLETPAQRRALLARSRTIAVVGASASRERPSYDVFTALRADGRFAVTPINPALGDGGIDGTPAFASLAAYAAERGAPDIVDVFRRADDAPAVASEAVAVGARAIWFQLGVVSAEAIRIAGDAGLDIVVDHCIKVDAARG